jgi:hypothetical protein
MAQQPPTQVQRDANLDALQVALNQWATSETLRLDNEVKFMRSVLQGRGAVNVGTTNLASTSTLLQTAINDFLVSG